jgi:hypothetical protein
MMEEHEINPYMVQRFLRSLVSLYGQTNNNRGGQLASPSASATSKAAIIGRDKSPEQVRKLMVSELKAKIRSVTAEIQKTKVSSPADKKQLRKIEAKLDIYRSRLEKLEKQAS